MTKLKLALCQIKVADNKEQNVEKAVEMISTSADKNADIAVLPEMFNCPFQNDKFIEYSEEEENSPTLEAISKIANEKNIYVLAGSIPEKVIGEDSKEKIYNTSFFFDDNGKIIAKHRKMHLFDIDIPEKGVHSKESEVITPGDKFSVIDTKFGKIGMALCYDVRFPELAMLMALNGAKILFYPGAFTLVTGAAHWELLFKSRAVDNQVFCVGVSPATNEDLKYHAYGHSIVVNPWGDILIEAGSDENLLFQEIDLEEVDKIREELPTLKNRRSDLYKIDFKG
ncbi:carbon-nitrogen hydrolase family protein [Methanobrevibacter sp. OttesenSCG-928-K11]|nr:carbon-nitrogen hydrolase family protein [Methanobrevibacter sp. OttesenSCG-928-K11]MDL2270578.1 carbon-nitrogen hydrolase family protein [Methanobrevibacter sp. OttesenSCG-928-I08]